MSRKSRLPQSRRHLFIYDDDWDFLQTFFGPDGPTPIGVGTFVKEVIHLEVKGLRARMAEAADQEAQVGAGAGN